LSRRDADRTVCNKHPSTGDLATRRLAARAAGTLPERIVAAASYHGSRLATDDPTSLHLLAPKIRSRVYVGGATDDASFPGAMKARIEEALTHAGVDHQSDL